MKIKFTYENVITTIKLSLIILLAVIEAFVCAQAYSPDYISNFIAAAVCCAVLLLVEGVNGFFVKRFAYKMVFFGIDSALLLAICFLTGNSFLSTMYCIVLTNCYMTVEKFGHKTILFGMSCGLYTVSFIVGWVLRNPELAVYNSIVEILTGVFFGLVAIAIDFIIVEFLVRFYRNNRQLSVALKEADKSRARLEEVYEQLTRTKVYEERNRIARDIHDNAGHSMTSVIMQTEAAKLLIDEDPEEAKNRIISANIQARNALEQMRESVHLLAGREQAVSLRDELEEIIAQTIDGTDVKARFDLDEVEPGEEVYRFIRNSVKELLANGIRHGKATAFYIELKKTEDGIKLYVSDNGLGVDGEPKEGFGLKGIREKAEKLGGTCRFSGEKDEGFEADIALPLQKEVKDD